MKTSGIGGQAVIEGIMMRNQDKYSIAVRKPDNEIEVVVKDKPLLTKKYYWLNYPIIRGIFNFFDSLITGVSTINYSASFFDDPSEQKSTKADEIGKTIFNDKFESILMAITVLFSVALALLLFTVLPFGASRLFSRVISSQALLNFIEGIIRFAIFIVYLWAISQINDIKRTFMYHGAEHKCINCIESGAKLTPINVQHSSRYHKRCGTSFLFIVMFISIVFFIFIRVENTVAQIIIRVLLMPVIAGVSYEAIKWMGKYDNKYTNVLSKPGMWIQSLTTREPDMDMIEVAIAAVEEVFDWKAFLIDYYKDSEDPEAEMKAVAAELAIKGNFIIQKKQTRSIDVSEASDTVAKEEERRNDYEETAAAMAMSDALSAVDGIIIEEDFEDDEANLKAFEQHALDKPVSAKVGYSNAAASKDGLDDDAKSQSSDEVEEEDEIAGFEIEEVEENTEVITADDLPVFKQREHRK